MPCVTVPLNLLETGGTRSTAFDFQLRPVGHLQSQGPVMDLLRFKDLVSKHEHGRVNLTKFTFQRSCVRSVSHAKPPTGKNMTNSGNFLKRKVVYLTSDLWCGACK